MTQRSGDSLWMFIVSEQFTAMILAFLPRFWLFFSTNVLCLFDVYCLRRILDQSVGLCWLSKSAALAMVFFFCNKGKNCGEWGIIFSKDKEKRWLMKLWVYRQWFFIAHLINPYNWSDLLRFNDFNVLSFETDLGIIWGCKEIATLSFMFAPFCDP